MKRLLFILFLTLSFIFSAGIQAQTGGIEEGLRQSAIDHMTAGRYGEAIDLLNKFISANPRLAEGYHLRAQCFEQRSQYQESVLDYRRASRLEPNNQRILADLNRVIEVWYALLYRKIEGHEREIAIDPTDPFNYLEIGKSYRWLEQWTTAEEWYDQYLARDNNASPDEIIRYTEILAKTGSLVKGERILKEFVERYPGDWRLWSRYGYFTLWLGKYRIAKEAFETALSYKPFFKEAQDGLDLTKREGYITKYDPRAFENVYLIDEYFRKLKKDPFNYQTRFKLVDELVKETRFEEASQQLSILAADHYESDQYIFYSSLIDSLSTTLYESQVEKFSESVKLNPQNKSAVVKLATAYGKLYAYDETIEVLEEHLSGVPENEDLDVRFLYAKYSAWNYEWEKAITQLDKLLEMDPDNLDYQLLRGKISVWTVLDLDEAQSLLENVLAKRPQTVDAMLSLATLHAWNKEFEIAKDYIDRAKVIDPVSTEVEAAESNYALHLSAYEELQILKIRGVAGEFALAGECDSALVKYDEYLSKITGPNRQELKEYADINACAGNYETAIELYNLLLGEGYDYDIALGRARGYLLSGDTLTAVTEFNALVMEDSTDFETRLYLADLYSQIGEADSARTQYNILLNMPIDSAQIAIVKRHKKWLPVYSLESFFDTFPTSIGFNPSGTYYSDNVNLRFRNIGGRLDFGLTHFMSIGGTFYKAFINSDLGYRTFTSLRGNLLFRLAQNINLGLGFGSANTYGASSTQEFEAFFRYEIKDTLSVSASYNGTDAALLLYSPDLLHTRIPATMFRFNINYVHTSRFTFGGYFQYVKVQEYSQYGSNAGNDLQIRIGNLLSEYFTIGYEYFFSNYRYDSDYYYSPRDIESHSVWADLFLEKRDNLRVSFGGKLGTIPGSDLLIFEAHTDTEVKFNNTITISGRLALGSTSRDDSSYKYFSAQVSAYLSF